MKRYGILLVFFLCVFTNTGIQIHGESDTYEVETKVFSEDRKPIEGALFYLYKDGYIVAEDITSNAQGIVEIKDLTYGDYMLYQQSSSYGYDKIDTNIVFHINEETKGKQYLDTIKNKRMQGNASITLLDEQGKIISNIWMSIQNEQGVVLKSLKSDKKGNIKIQNLPVGSYFIQQKDTKSEYFVKENVEFDITPYNCQKELDMSLHLQKHHSIHEIQDYSFAIGFVVIVICGIGFGIYFFRRHSFTQFLDDFMV